MDARELRAVIDLGEAFDVEFKRRGNKVEGDVFETICSFANGLGGTILLGVEDDGSASGLKKSALLSARRDVVNVLNNPEVFGPPAFVEMEDVAYGDAWVVRVWVPASAAVHGFKGRIHGRLEDSDVAVRLPPGLRRCRSASRTSTPSSGSIGTCGSRTCGRTSSPTRGAGPC